MILRFISWLARRRGMRIVPWTSLTIEVPRLVQVMEKDARPLVLNEEPSVMKGEGKRHQVYARMLKLYPDAEKADVALAIELAVRRMKGLL